MKIKSLAYNWRQVGSALDRDGSGEDYDYVEVGKPKEGKVVVEIIENEPRNGMQLWNFEIIFDDTSVKRVFNPNTVDYYPK